MSKREETRQSRFSPGLVAAMLVGLFFALALWLRVYLPYDKVFSGEWVKFTGNDAYYHMRLVDNFARNFPHLMTFDPYLSYPGGQGVGTVHLFDWFLASLAWIIGLGSPTEHIVDLVGVYVPPILGALVVIPVYFIGKELGGRWTGVIAAALIALLPGEFLGRSILGYADHHVAETLITTVVMLFLILAVRTAAQRQLTFTHLKRRDWAIIARPIVYSLLAGFSLGLFIFTWIGALLFAFIIFLCLIVQFVIDHLRRRPTDYLCLIGVILFSVALIMSRLGASKEIDMTPLTLALLALPVLSVISRLMASKQIKPAYYPLSLAGLGLAGLAILYLTNPTLLTTILAQFSIFAPTGNTALTTIEMQPFLFPIGYFTLAIAWGNFTTSFFLSFISLGILIYLVIKHGDAEKSLLVVWSLVILLATLGQRRFAYYLAVNAALLTGYLSWQALSLVGFKESIAQPVKAAKQRRDKRVRPKARGFHITVSQVNMALGVLIIFLLVFAPNVLFPEPKAAPTIATASRAQFAPSDAWMSALTWLKENSPDPFGDPDSYYELEVSDKYPEPAYGVMAWWDYGYWITRIAHRIPNANPSQAPEAITSVAKFFTAQDESSANKIAQELGSKYIILDHEVAYIDPRTAVSKFWAVAMWAGKEPMEFFYIYQVPQGDRLVPVMLYHPEYYRSLSTRLFSFDGAAVVAKNPLVISYEESATREGRRFWQITSARSFPTYEEAEAYLLSQNSTNYKIVGTDPLVSPVPLEALEHYKLVRSEGSLGSGNSTMPAIKIFEYTD